MRATEQDCESNIRASNTRSENRLGGELAQNLFTSPVTQSTLLKESPVAQSALSKKSPADCNHQPPLLSSFSDSDLTQTSGSGQC
jgi:hypothetical protein